MTHPAPFVRFHAARSSPSGRYPGVFALANGLASDGQLSAHEAEWLSLNNAWFENTLTDPSTVDPGVYDRTLHPTAVAWFKTSAQDLLDRVAGYLALLDAHGIEWVERRSECPGRILYEDTMQVVVE